MQILVATSNEDKVRQYEIHLPKGYRVKQLIQPEVEIKHELPEIISIWKAFTLWRRKVYGVISDDRALYLIDTIPGTDIKTFLKQPQIFDRLFQGKKGKLVYSLSYTDLDGIHLYSHYLNVKIVKPSRSSNKWGELGKRLAVPPSCKPLSEYNKKEEEELERKLSKEIFLPFIGMVLGIKRKAKRRHYSEVVRINSFFSKMKHGILEKINDIVKEKINADDFGVNGLTLRKRVLLSSAYFPPSLFFDIKMEDGFYFNIQRPISQLKKGGDEILEKLIDFHSKRIKKQRDKVKLIKELEEEELTKGPGKIIRKGSALMVRREDGTDEVLYFKEYFDYETTKEVLGKLHYLQAPRDWKKVYALTDKEGMPKAIISVSRVERKYKKRLLLRDGIRDVVEVARGYNTMWKVKGVLSFLYSELSRRFKTLLTAYQPSFAKGISVYSSNFLPYLIKPQQNFYEMEKDVPIFRVRRSIKGKRVKRGKMPLLPSFEMIYPGVRTMHIMFELMK